jgi:hypothetical protein
MHHVRQLPSDGDNKSQFSVVAGSGFESAEHRDWDSLKLD